MIDAATQARLDQSDAWMSQTIREYGWAVQYVYPCDDDCPHGAGAGPPDETPIAYTVGLFGMGHPELLVLGMCWDNAVGVLNEVGSWIRAGRDLVPGELVTFPSWSHRIVPEPIPNPGEIVFSANRHYQRPREVSVPVLQLTYDDTGGSFPWDPGYTIPAWVQPRPGTYTA